MKISTITLSLLTLCCSLSANAISILGTDSFNGHTYALLSSDNWTNSESFAISQGGHLITINNAAEKDWLTLSAFGGVGQSSSFWIGYMRDLTTGNFEWASGETSTYTNWSFSEPNNQGGNEDYVHTYTDGTWNDLANDSGYYGAKFGVIEFSAPSNIPLPASAPLLLSALGIFGLARKRT